MFLLVATACLAQINPCAFDGYKNQRTIGFKVDRLPDNFDVGTPGDNNTWLFSSLQSATFIQYFLDGAESGKYSVQFPEADYVVKKPDGSEEYIYEDRGKWYTVGRVMLEKDAIEPIVLRYKRPNVACMMAADGTSRLTSQSYDIERTNKEGIKEIFVVQENQSEVVDAKGRLYLPQGIFDAYRVKKDVTVNTTLSASLVPFDIEGYTTYLFLDEVTEEVLLELRMDAAGEIEWASYKADDSFVPTKPKVGNNQFTLYPTTSFGDIRMDFVNFEKGEYTFEVYNIIGKKFWSTRYQISGDMTLKEDLTFLPKGTYMYTISDRNRNNLITRRFAIINP